MEPRIVTVREARDNLGRILDAAHYAGDATIVTRQGEEWAAIVPLESARQYIEQQNRPTD